MGPSIDDPVISSTQTEQQPSTSIQTSR